jgi:hypothetical protein
MTIRAMLRLLRQRPGDAEAQTAARLGAEYPKESPPARWPGITGPGGSPSGRMTVSPSEHHDPDDERALLLHPLRHRVNLRANARHAGEAALDGAVWDQIGGRNGIA